MPLCRVTVCRRTQNHIYLQLHFLKYWIQNLDFYCRVATIDSLKCSAGRNPFKLLTNSINIFFVVSRNSPTRILNKISEIAAFCYRNRLSKFQDFQHTQRLAVRFKVKNSLDRFLSIFTKVDSFSELLSGCSTMPPCGTFCFIRRKLRRIYTFPKASGRSEISVRYYRHYILKLMRKKYLSIISHVSVELDNCPCYHYVEKLLFLHLVCFIGNSD